MSIPVGYRRVNKQAEERWEQGEVSIRRPYLVPNTCLRNGCDGRLNLEQEPQAYERGYLVCQSCSTVYEYAYRERDEYGEVVEHGYFITRDTAECPICGTDPLPIIEEGAEDQRRGRVHCRACENTSIITSYRESK